MKFRNPKTVASRPRQASTLGLAVRLVVIVLLAAAGWMIWTGLPGQGDSQRATRFCAGIEPGTPTLQILKAATQAGSTGIESPRPGVLVVAFGQSRCELAVDATAP